MCEFNPGNVYSYNNIVRVEGNSKNPGKLYIYVDKEESGPYPKHTSITEIPGWKLLLNDGKLKLVSN